MDLTTRFKGTQEFAQALSVSSRETTTLGYAADFVDVEWFPSGSYLIEQGGPSTTMYFLLSGRVEIRWEGDDGHVRVVDHSGPGEFIGEVGIAPGRPRNAHVVAVDDVTSLTFLRGEPGVVDPRGARPYAGSNLVDMGRGAVHTRLLGRRVTLVPVEVAGREATRNVCGVLVAMPQGQSWAPTPSIGVW